MASRSRLPGYQRLHAFSFELRRLSESSSALLGAALIGADANATSAEILRSRLVWPLEDVAVIEKCNAIIVVATVAIDTDPGFVRDVVLESWLEEAADLARVLPKIDHYCGLEALKYLGEVAVGLRSVVLGDGQVYAQVLRGLQTALGADDRRSPVSVVSHRLVRLRKAVRSGTSLQEGNISLERCAAERLTADLGTSGAKVAIAGYGRTGQLLARILLKETRHELVVTNRTPLTDTGIHQGRMSVAAWGDVSIHNASDAMVICLTNTAETRRYVERAFEAMASGKPPFVLDMSSPSITRQIARGQEEVLQLEELAAQASRNLQARQGGINKAKQFVDQWAEELEHDLAALAARDGQGRRKRVAGPGHDSQIARRRDQILRVGRDSMRKAGFVETQTRCLTGTAGLRRSIRMDADTATAGIEGVYEVGPVWAPDASWAPSDIDEMHVLAARTWRPLDLDQLVDLALGLVQRAAQETEGVAIVSRRIDYETAFEMLLDSGYSVAYCATLDFNVLRSIADVVRFDTGEQLVAVTNCPESSERFELVRNPKTRLARSFRIVLDGWQVASGSLLELNTDALRRHLTLSGAAVARIEPPLDDINEEAMTAEFEVALDHLVARCTGGPATAS